MIRAFAATLALFVGSPFAAAQAPEQAPQPATSHAQTASTSSETHIPSAGLTMELLQSLPPRYNRWSAYSTYRPTYLSTGPFFNVGYPYRTYGFRPYGMGGYYPQGVGGRYRSSIGLLFWW